MESKVYLENWSIVGDRVKLDYRDGDTLYVLKKDFDRAFGCIVSSTKSQVLNDFACR